VEKISRRSIAIIYIATIAYGLTNIAGLTPLKGAPWESIIKIR
jgi:hypothetical protein